METLLPRNPPPMDAAPPLQHTNRRGDTYFLHRGTTRTGKPRYFAARTVGPGALSEMPAGHEFCESVNGIVSVRRQLDPHGLVSEADLAVARRELARHRHLVRHVADRRKDEIVIYEPLGFPSEREMRQMQEMYGAHVGSIAEQLDAMQARAQYTPVMKFCACAERPGEYVAYRRFYSGEGGWLLLSAGTIEPLLRTYLPSVATERFFELY